MPLPSNSIRIFGQAVEDVLPFGISHEFLQPIHSGNPFPDPAVPKNTLELF